MARRADDTPTGDDAETTTESTDGASPAEQDEHDPRVRDTDAPTDNDRVVDDGTISGRGARRGDRPQQLPGVNPRWWAPVMVGLMIVGLLWIIAFYLGNNAQRNGFPIPGIGYGNLAVGFVLIMAGFVMTTRWK